MIMLPKPWAAITTCALVLGSVQAQMITAAPKLHLAARQVPAPCSTFYNIQLSCSAATQGFTNLPFSSQADCLCYRGTSFNPLPYDAGLSTCLNYLSTASPAIYSSLNGDSLPSAPCLLVAPTDVTTIPTSTTSSTSTRGTVIITTSSRTTPFVSTTSRSSTTAGPGGAIACNSLTAIYSSCEAQYAGFTTLPFETEASCLCYQDNTWAPTVFDNILTSCASYLLSDPTYSSDARNVLATPTPCESVGDVAGAGAGPDSSTSSTSRLTTTSRRASTTTSTPTSTTSSSASRCSTDASRATCGAMALGANVGKSLLVIQVVQIVYMLM